MRIAKASGEKPVSGTRPPVARTPVALEALAPPTEPLTLEQLDLREEAVSPTPTGTGRGKEKDPTEIAIVTGRDADPGQGIETVTATATVGEGGLGLDLGTGIAGDADVQGPDPGTAGDLDPGKEGE